jgi:hypothetical protein
VNFRDVEADMQRTRYAFLSVDLELCATFSKIVETELAAGKPDAAHKGAGECRGGLLHDPTTFS